MTNTVIWGMTGEGEPERIGCGRWGMRVLKGLEAEETLGENYVTTYVLSFDRNRNRAKERKPRKKGMGARNARHGRREIWAP